MQKIKIAIFMMMGIILVSGCTSFNVPTVENPTSTPVELQLPTITLEVPTEAPPSLSDEVIRNSTYLSPQMQVGVTLVNGEFSGEVDGIPFHASMHPEIARGDLNDDGVEDAAFLLSEDTGGSGVFVSLMVIYSDEGEYTQAPGYFIEDRPLINAISFDRGEVLLDALLHAPNDPMVSPTFPVMIHFDVFADATILTRLTSRISDGGSRSIDISAPIDGQLVSESVQVVGSMPIGPFESNLSIRILDENGQQLYQSGFMVQAEEMGAPATFDNLVNLPDLSAGSLIILELSELSMADGSRLAVDTVVLKIE